MCPLTLKRPEIEPSRYRDSTLLFYTATQACNRFLPATACDNPQYQSKFKFDDVAVKDFPWKREGSWSGQEAVDKCVSWIDLPEDMKKHMAELLNSCLHERLLCVVWSIGVVIDQPWTI